MPSAASVSSRSRLDGLDLARFLAFIGMVIVNFRIVMGASGGAEGGEGVLSTLVGALEGRAAATFVVLAGIGLGLSSARLGQVAAITITLRRAAFLFVIGLLNMLVFEADILHYYAIYFLLGAACIRLRDSVLVGVIVACNVLFVVMFFTLDYDAGWDWKTLSYQGFWTPFGFIRNLFFNGWHPVFPWFGFLAFGIWLSRLDLSKRGVQHRLMLWGAVGAAIALTRLICTHDTALGLLLTASPIPPAPVYVVSAMGTAAFVTGLCLRIAERFDKGLPLALVLPAGRQTLTLYVAHILIGMGTLEELGLLGGQSVETALAAALGFCLLSALYSAAWARFFRRGPIETAMRRLAG